MTPAPPAAPGAEDAERTVAITAASGRVAEIKIMERGVIRARPCAPQQRSSVIG